jgi:hypothetical protein
MNNAEKIEIGAKTFKAFCKAANVKAIKHDDNYVKEVAYEGLVHKSCW